MQIARSAAEGAPWWGWHRADASARWRLVCWAQTPAQCWAVLDALGPDGERQVRPGEGNLPADDEDECTPCNCMMES